MSDTIDRLEAARRAWPWPQRDAVTIDEVPLHMWPAVELVDALEARVAELEAAQVTAVFVVLPHLDYEGYGAPLSAHTTREAAWLAAAAIKKQGNDKYTKYEVEEVALAAEKGDK